MKKNKKVKLLLNKQLIYSLDSSHVFGGGRDFIQNPTRTTPCNEPICLITNNPGCPPPPTTEV